MLNAEAPIQFVRPPKVMPARSLGKEAFVLGFVENTGQTAVTGIAINVIVRSENGEVVETNVFRPRTSRLEPGSEIKFEGTMDHLDPKRTEFSLDWNH